MKQNLIKRILLFLGVLLISAPSVFAGDGLTCETAKVISEGVTIGNGSYGGQFFSYSATTDGYMEISPLDGSLYNVAVLRGVCATLLQSDLTGSGNKLYVKINNGEQYSLYFEMYYSFGNFNLSVVPSVPKEFLNFKLSDGTDNFIAKVDTVANTLNIDVPTSIDLSSLRTSFATTASTINSVFINGSQIQSDDMVDLTGVTQIEIKDSDSNSKLYTLMINKVERLTCTTALPITEGNYVGNGNDIQYYKYTATTNGYLRIKLSQFGGVRISSSSGNCGATTLIDDGYYYPESPLFVQTEIGKIYTFKTNFLYDFVFSVTKYEALPKEILQFSLYNGYDQMEGTIDTVENTIHVRVPTDYDLTQAKCEIVTSANDLIQLSINGNSIAATGTVDLSNATTLTLTDPSSKTATYTLNIVKVDGLSCGTSMPLSIGETVGNGGYVQYYNFTPTLSGYYQFYPKSFGVSSFIYSGDCDNQKSVAGGFPFKGRPLEFKCDAGTKYTFKISGLSTRVLEFKSLSSLSKEFTRFIFYSNSSWLDRYDAVIDTVDNTIVVTLPNDYDISKSYINYDKTGMDLTKATINGVEISLSGGSTDLTGVTQVKILGEDGLESVYSLTINRMAGISCSSATVVSEGVTAGNGAETQYFKFTAPKDGILNLSYDDMSAFDIYVFNGDCSLLSEIGRKWSDKNVPLQIDVTAGSTYYIVAKMMREAGLLLEYGTSTYMNIVNFSIASNVFNQLGEIDNNLGTISFVMPVGLDISHMWLQYGIESDRLVSVSANGVPLVNYGYVNLDSVKKLTLTDQDGATKEYTVQISRMSGSSCDDSKKIDLGVTQGQGDFAQFFNFTPTLIGYYSIQVEEGCESNISVTSGSCSSEISAQLQSGRNSVVVKCIANELYSIRIDQLSNYHFTISYSAEVPKDFLYYSISNNNQYYSAAIDTVANSINISKFAAYDLSKSACYYSLLATEYSSVLSGNSSVESGDVLDLTSIHSLVIRDVENKELTYSLIVENDGATSLDVESLASGALRVYPNPSSDIFYVDLTSISVENGSLEVYNVAGNLVYSSPVLESKSCQLSLKNQPKGVYFLKVYSSNLSKTIKLIKQ